jgi:uncharacterized protein with PIN domain
MELLWFSVVLMYILGSTIYFGLDYRAPRCRDCQTSALMLSQQIAGSSPPIFEVVYRCPSCHEILWKRFVSTIAD